MTISNVSRKPSFGRFLAVVDPKETNVTKRKEIHKLLNETANSVAITSSEDGVLYSVKGHNSKHELNLMKALKKLGAYVTKQPVKQEHEVNPIVCTYKEIPFVTSKLKETIIRSNKVH
jgi:hypothetical protein